MTASWPPDWYPDPWNAADLRWWDGAQWTPASQRHGWRTWMSSSEGARRISLVVTVLAGCGLVGCALVLVGNLALRRAIPDLDVLLGIAIPAVVVGQVWTIGLLVVRQPPRPRGLRARFRSGWSRSRPKICGIVFRQLSRRLVVSAGILFFLGWLAMMTSFPSLTHGNPTVAGSGCRYRLENHGSTVCVSQAAFRSAGAAEQRLVAGVLMGFFALHSAVALSRARERSGDSTRTAR